MSSPIVGNYIVEHSVLVIVVIMGLVAISGGSSLKAAVSLQFPLSPMMRGLMSAIMKV